MRIRGRRRGGKETGVREGSSSTGGNFDHGSVQKEVAMCTQRHRYVTHVREKIYADQEL